MTLPAAPLAIGPTPHRCPVCNGNGLVPRGFYMRTTDTWTTTDAAPEACRACVGGIVWSPPQAPPVTLPAPPDLTDIWRENALEWRNTRADR